jgi:hypothetical protein
LNIAGFNGFFVSITERIHQLFRSFIMSQPSHSSVTSFESLSQKVSNYNGYEDVAVRERSDRELRDHLVHEIDAILQQYDAIEHTENSEDQPELDKFVESTKRKLNTLCESLNNPTYSGVPFFSVDRIPEKRLTRLYDLESGLLDELEMIAEETASLLGNSLRKEMFEDHFLHIYDFVDNVNQFLFEREALILGDD